MQSFRSDRLLVEPLMAGHAHALFEGLCDPALYIFVPQDPPLDLPSLEARYRKLETRVSPDGHYKWLNWVMHMQEGGGPVGVLEATLPEAGASASIAYLLLRSHWGRGLGSEAVQSLTRHLQTAYGVRLFEASADTRNAASIQVLLKNEFHIVETIAQADFFKGARSDEYRFERMSGAA